MSTETCITVYHAWLCVINPQNMKVLTNYFNETYLVSGIYSFLLRDKIDHKIFTNSTMRFAVQTIFTEQEKNVYRIWSEYAHFVISRCS